MITIKGILLWLHEMMILRLILFHQKKDYIFMTLCIVSRGVRK